MAADLALLALLLLVNGAGVVMVVFQLPGTWVMLAGTGLVAWVLWDDGYFGWWTLGLLLALAILGEVVETASGAVGSRRAGGSRRGAVLSIGLGIVGAVVGGSVAGALALPIAWAVPAWLLSVIGGAAVGAAAGAMLGERWAGQPWTQVRRAGVGAAIGRIGGTLGKICIAAAMWVVVLVSVFV